MSDERILDKQTIKDLTGWLDLVEAKHPGPWSHVVKEELRLVTIKDTTSPVIVPPVTDVAMLLAHLSPDTLRELIRGYMLYRAEATALPLRYLAMAQRPVEGVAA